MTDIRIYPGSLVSRHLRLLCALVAAAAVAAPALPANAQTAACFDESEETPEGYGPTDISAVSGNGGLSVAFNHDATITVLKWPSPSYYDQIKYRTTDRSRRFFGALRNEGAFVGVAWKSGGSWRFSWLRNWPSRQRFADDDTDEVRTRFRNRKIGLSVALRDVVMANRDVLARHVIVRRTARSRVKAVRVISFANFNPVFSKTPQSPTDDWCSEENNDDGARWLESARVVLHRRSGTDSSTGEASAAALVMGFANRAGSHQVGPDTFAGNQGGTSAYVDARDARLNGRDQATGQADAAIADRLSLRSRKKRSTTVLIASAAGRKKALAALRAARRTSIGPIARAKAAWWRRWLESSPLPRGAPRRVVKLAKRSLMTMRQAIDSERDMIVASIATQAPYGLDWVRDGSFINRALDEAGHPRAVARHDIRYGELQVGAGNPPDGGPPAPSGNWSQNYYADGVVGGPIPYEIDETGLGIWTLWDHYAQTGDRDYLLVADVYEAIQRAAHYLSDEPPIGCIDPTNRLQCLASEGDNEAPSQTLKGAEAVWLGLDSAVRAAQVRGGETAGLNATKWRARRNELGAAIETQFFDEDCTCYTTDYDIGATLLWPVGFLEPGTERSDAQADVNWRHMKRVLDGRTRRGSYETKLLLGNSHAWEGRPTRMARIKKGLEWVARVPTTNGTGLLGEAWMEFPAGSERIATMVSQPHATTHALFYLAALEAYGREPYRF